MLTAVKPTVIEGKIDDVMDKLAEDLKKEVNRQLDWIRSDTGLETDGMKIRIRYYGLEKTFVTLIEELA